MNGFTLYLTQKTVPVSVEITGQGRLTITDGDKIWLQVSGPWAALETADIAEPARLPADDPPKRLNPSAPNWDWLTPAMVIEHFRQSEDLKALYNDVRAALEEAGVNLTATSDQLELDLATVRPHLGLIIQDGRFTYGHQSRIAEALVIPNQGSYRRRIQNVVTELSREFSTSSTAPAGPARAKSGARAA